MRDSWIIFDDDGTKLPFLDIPDDLFLKVAALFRRLYPHNEMLMLRLEVEEIRRENGW